MAKKKNTRMFSREMREANAVKRRPLTAEEIDKRAIDGYSQWLWPNAKLLAEAWLHIQEDTDRLPEETMIANAMGRRFRQLTGDTLTMEVAEAIIDDEDASTDY